MRILQINTVCGRGSTGRIAVDIAKTAEEEGYECLIAYGRADGGGFHNSYKIGSKLGNYIHAAGTRLTGKHGLYSVCATKKLVQKIDEYNPDIVHLHNLHGYYLNYPILFECLADSGRNVVWTLHDCWSFTGHCVYFDFAGCGKWTEQCFKCPQKKTYPASSFLDNSYKNYILKKKFFTLPKKMTLITPSFWLSNLVGQSFLGDYPTKVINNGIDLEVFKPAKSDFRTRYSLEGKVIILGAASVWSARKGFEDFIKLAKEAGEKYKIVLVGLDKKRIGELPSNVIGIEKTENVSQLAEIYSAADVFFNPTYEDNFPTVNLEAMACGTPVVTYNTGGSGESVSGAGCGAVVEKGDFKKVLDIAVPKSAEISDICRAYAKKNFDKKNCYRQYLDMYRGFSK